MAELLLEVVNMENEALPARLASAGILNGAQHLSAQNKQRAA